MDKRFEKYEKLLKSLPHLAPPEKGESEDRTEKRLKILQSIQEAEDEGLYDVAEHWSGDQVG